MYWDVDPVAVLVPESSVSDSEAVGVRDPDVSVSSVVDAVVCVAASADGVLGAESALGC